MNFNSWIRFTKEKNGDVFAQLSGMKCTQACLGSLSHDEILPCSCNGLFPVRLSDACRIADACCSRDVLIASLAETASFTVHLCGICRGYLMIWYHWDRAIIITCYRLLFSRKCNSTILSGIIWCPMSVYHILFTCPICTYLFASNYL